MYLIFNIRNFNISRMNLMVPQINLLHLKFLCDAVHYNSISEAAKMNFVTQSAVSQGIRKLEKILATQLLTHSRKKFQLTLEGKIVFEQARHVFKSLQNIYEEINQSKEVVAGDLKIVSTKSLGMSFIPSCYKKMKMDFPQVDMQVRLGGLNYIRNSIKQNDVELGIVVYDQDFAHFAKHSLKKGKFNLYQSTDRNQQAFIENGVLVNYFEGTHVKELQDHLQRKYPSLKIQAELSGWEVIARFTELNMGIGFYPDYIIANNRYQNIEAYPIELPDFEYEICAIYNKGGKLSRCANAFIEQFSLD